MVVGLKQKIYKDRQPTVDLFREIVESKLKKDSMVLNVGCGFIPFGIKGKCKQVIGIDLDERARQNLDLDAVFIEDIKTFKYLEQFDIIIIQWVVEHLENPREVFANLYRLLKINGNVIILTSNSTHYISEIGKRTPYRFNKWFYKFIHAEEDTYPVYYRSNTPKKLYLDMVNAGFYLSRFEAIEPDPNYLEFSLPSYVIGIGMEKLLSTHMMWKFRRDMIGVFVK